MRRSSCETIKRDCLVNPDSFVSSLLLSNKSTATPNKVFYIDSPNKWVNDPTDLFSKSEKKRPVTRQNSFEIFSDIIMIENSKSIARVSLLRKNKTQLNFDPTKIKKDALDAMLKSNPTRREEIKGSENKIH